MDRPVGVRGGVRARVVGATVRQLMGGGRDDACRGFGGCSGPPGARTRACTEALVEYFGMNNVDASLTHVNNTVADLQDANVDRAFRAGVGDFVELVFRWILSE